MNPALRTALIRVLQRVLLVSGLICGGFGYAGERGPVIPQGKGDQCVAETDFMRRNHMDLIVHQRDETVIRGIRDEPFSLVECVDCHARSDTEGKAIRIDAEGEFCASCHEFVAVKIDCFSCHAAVPDSAPGTHGDTAPGTHGDKALNSLEINEEETQDLVKRTIAHLQRVDSVLVIDKNEVLGRSRVDSGIRNE